jgi:hypothetical protein
MEGQHFMPWAILCPCYCRQKEINSASQKVQQWPNITESCCSNEKMMINQRISRQPISSSKAMLLVGFNSSTSNLSWGAVEVTHGCNSKGKK